MYTILIKTAPDDIANVRQHWRKRWLSMNINGYQSIAYIANISQCIHQRWHTFVMLSGAALIDCFDNLYGMARMPHHLGGRDEEI